jgi:hypothetical protein
MDAEREDISITSIAKDVFPYDEIRFIIGESEPVEFFRAVVLPYYLSITYPIFHLNPPLDFHNQPYSYSGKRMLI